MAIFGKIVGGVLGLMLGGPLGALLGAVAGHGLIDRSRSRAVAAGEAGEAWKAAPDPGVVFSLGVIALAAKVAKADGAVTEDEIRAFQRIFPFDAGERQRIARLYNEARRSADGFEAYAEQVRGALAGRPELLAEVVDALYAIALADGELHPEEARTIARIGEILGLGAYEMASIRARHAAEPAADRGAANAYAVLGVEPGATDDALRAAHRKLVRAYHPDRLVSKGLPEEFVTLANDRLAAINAAYETVKKARGIR